MILAKLKKAIMAALLVLSVLFVVVEATEFQGDSLPGYKSSHTVLNEDFCHQGNCVNGEWSSQVTEKNEDPCSSIVTRSGWHARQTKHSSYLSQPVSIVFIHHTVMDRCKTQKDCITAMQKVQELHMDVNKWDDIGYSFVVGEDGRAYEARGFDRVGAHTLGWNNVSISIAVMGDFTHDVPNDLALQAISDVIECGIQQNKISEDYKLHGHCDARPMFESPGKAFYPLIQTWPHYTPMMEGVFMKPNKLIKRN